MPLRTILTISALLLSVTPLHAQGTDVAAGTRVRVQSPCDPASRGRYCETVIGRVLPSNGDGLLVEDALGSTHRIDLANGSRLERSAGYRRHTLAGLGLGSLAGLATGAALAAGCTTGGEDDGFCSLYFLAAVPAGALVGSLIGASTRTERWEAVSAPAVGLHIWPLPGRATVALTIRF
jgi:hypothetical protein